MWCVCSVHVCVCVYSLRVCDVYVWYMCSVHVCDVLACVCDMCVCMCVVCVLVCVSSIFDVSAKHCHSKKKLKLNY